MAPYRAAFVTALAALLTMAACGEEPARRQDIVIRGADVPLAGTVVGPAWGGRHPAVVLLHGSGPDGRENPYYWMLADAFVQRGFVVLVYDKRGSGGSGGDWRRSPFSALIDDAAAAARMLRRHPWVDSARVGVWGGSEGAVIAPEVALRERLAFVAMQSGPGVTFAEQNLHQTGLQVRALTADPEERRAALRLQRLKHRYARRGDGWAEYQAALRSAAGTPYSGLAGPTSPDDWWWGWYRTKMDYSPVPALERLGVAVLAVWGDQDVLVPVEASRAAVAAARSRVDHPGDSLLVIAGADHALQVQGLRGVFRRGLRNRPVHLGLMADWAARQVEPPFIRIQPLPSGPRATPRVEAGDSVLPSMPARVPGARP
jgi:alpha-beta hydrolase superfamily lysophospholipase